MRPSRLPLLPTTVLLATIALLLVAPPAGAQSLLERTPNLSGGWVGSPGRVHFHFLHRFHLVDAGDESVIVNTPNFLLASPLPGNTLLGVSYASSSSTTPGRENEWEILGRWAALDADGESPVDVSVAGAYNTAASSVDGEVQAALPAGPFRLLGVARVFSDQRGRGEAGWAAGGGAVYRMSPGLALAADVVKATDLPDERAVAWGAGLQLRIPYSPHTLSIQATNTRTGTLLGSSEGFRERTGGDDHQIVWGFEFTVPLTLSTYFGG